MGGDDKTAALEVAFTVRTSRVGEGALKREGTEGEEVSWSESALRSGASTKSADSSSSISRRDANEEP